MTSVTKMSGAFTATEWGIVLKALEGHASTLNIVPNDLKRVIERVQRLRKLAEQKTENHAALLARLLAEGDGDGIHVRQT